MARLQSDVSTGKAGKKGAEVQNTGNDVGAPLPAQMMPLQGHKQGNPASVVSTPKGASLAQRGGRGAPPAMPGDTPLTGHHFMDNPARGNSPKRGPGRKTTEADREKLSTAGS